MKEKYSISEKVNKLVISLGEMLSWVYLFIVLISVYEVFMRYVFGKPTTWVHETSLSLAGIIMVYGGLYAFAKDKHINVNVITDLFPKRIQFYFKLVSNIISLVYVALLCISTILITKVAVFSPNGALQLERSGSSWNSAFPGISKIMMSLFILMFVGLIAIQIFSDILTKTKKKDLKDAVD